MVSSATAQLSPDLYNYPQNHLPWYSIETDHFQIHFQEGNSQSAQVTSRIAEEVYPPITSLYNFEPDTKTDIVLRDRQDYSNGAAYFFDNHIDIWVSALDTPFRGTHDWLWDVITHEFTHIVQLQTAMKRNRRFPAIYFQWLSYANVRRPDVLYGFPKGIITYPFSSINVPAWFAEGVAQYQRQQLYHDFWDSHRDMLLRTSLLADEPIDFQEMSFFTSKNGLEREQIYNQGFAFTTYLAEQYGESIIPKISDSLGQSGVFTIDEALEKSTGESAQQLFDSFIHTSKKQYKRAIDSLEVTATNNIEDQGFLNLYPKLSPDGSKLAYLSNKNLKALGTQLFIQPLDSNSSGQVINLGLLQKSSPNQHSGHYQEPIIKKIKSAYSFSKDGQQLAFSKQSLNKFGEQYNGLYIYDVDTQQIIPISKSKRLSSPAWHPQQNKLAAVQQKNRTQNIVELDISTGQIKQLTNFSEGEVIFTPSWHPDAQHIYFSAANHYSRNIYSYNINTNRTNVVLKDTLTDFRDPYIDASGNYLYYAADPDGIFNIYCLPLDQDQSQPQKITSVLGGAFMPHTSDDMLYFSKFTAEGYQIASTELPEKSDDKLNLNHSYQRSELTNFKIPDSSRLTDRPSLDEIESLSQKKLQKLGRSDSLSLNQKESNSGNPAFLHPYDNNFTSISFYPVIRFDNYSKKNGPNGRLLTNGKFGALGENLLRDLKIGTYFSSRDVTDQLNIFGGFLIGPASESASGIGDFFSPSRLTDIDRDLFLITEYQGLPFIKKRWSPTISLEFYSQRRNVADGLSIEEFPCTSCLPDTTTTDIAYNIWEANLFLRSKINAQNIIELGVGYSPYEVQTDGFFSEELQQFVPSSSSEYFRGTRFTAAYTYEQFWSYPHADVAPLGLRTSLRYSYEPNKLLEEYEISGGTLSPVYETVKNHSVQASVRYGFPVSTNTAVNLYGRGFSYLNKPNDFFYLDYIGGFSGMRSYPYFALGGNTTAMLTLSYTFPLLRGINKEIGRHTMDKLYLRLFAEGGNGWDGPLQIGNTIKTGLGGELRFAFNSYYLFPVKLFVSGAYGFNTFDVTLPDNFITETSGGKISYGKEFIFHFGLTFDFNVFNHSQ
ncbi:WD40-like Beta Propeller Repeat [Fodinibius salinus]|uniref:WD40-like Beta Propeller Repeat n=2 Tax=Fodinibius salinus TaxID=860790 RepID=A0A5D3YNV1_9BACT|nr:WD40-like Beta Propeller Repeat [Fodinibius salinus]